MRVEGPQYENGQKKSQNQLFEKLTSSSHWRVKMEVKSVLVTVMTVEALLLRPSALGFRIRLEKLKIRISSVRGERELIAAYQRLGWKLLHRVRKAWSAAIKIEYLGYDDGERVRNRVIEN